MSDSEEQSFSLFGTLSRASNTRNLNLTTTDKTQLNKKRKRKATPVISGHDDRVSSLKSAEPAKKMKTKLHTVHTDPSFEQTMLPATYLGDEKSDSYLGNSDSSSDQETKPYVERKGMVTKTPKKEDNSWSGESVMGQKSSRAFDESGSEHDEDSGEEEDTDREYLALKKELSCLSFEELLKVKERIGLKVFNQLMYGSKLKSDVTKTSKPNKKFKRENKNRPMEISSKIHVPRVRQIMPVKKKIARDPRFDDLSGQYNETFFKEAYSFLDDVKAKEKEKVKVLLKKEKDEEKKKNMQALVNRMNQQEQSMLQKKKQTELLNEWKKKEEDRVREGKNPYFLKKSDKKLLVLAEKYKELKKSGKVEKYLNKKRKKNAQKERKKLPGRLDH